MQAPEEELALDEAGLLISACANPGLDVAAQMGRLDDLAARVEPADADGLCQLLFDVVGLRGDRENYDDPANSYLDQVLDRRLGIPISLSVLLMEIGRRCRIPLEAVGMPGHFLVRDSSDPEHLIDAFDGGRRLSRDDCQRILQSISGGSAALTPDMLATTGRRAVLARMLANLDVSFERRNDRRSLRWLSDLRQVLPGAPPGDRVQLAGRLTGLGRFDSAATILEGTAEGLGPVPAAGRMLQEAKSLRARLN